MCGFSHAPQACIYIMKKKEIVKNKNSFNEIIKNGKVIKSKYIYIYYNEREDEDKKFGIAVGKKHLNAVYRNLMKRRIRNIIDKNKLLFQNGRDYIIMVKKDGINLSYEILEDKIKLMLKVNK